MTRCKVVVLTALLALAVGCDRSKNEPVDEADLMLQKPTEDEVSREVRARSSRIIGHYGSGPVEVTLLSPLMEVPVLYFTKIKQAVDPAAVACYVAIQSERVPRSREPGQVTIELVVVGRESGRFKPGDRGKVCEYQIVSTEYMARDYFGPDWLAEHPWPKDAKAK